MLNNVEPADQFHAVAAWNVDPEMATLPAFPIGAPHQALEETSEIAIDDLVFTVVAAFRRHPHLNNVLTHISGARWERVEQALRAILDPVSRSRELSPLARNIVDLMCADRGITGRILKPYFRDLLATVLSPRLAARLTANVTCLFLEFEVAERQPTTVASTNAPSLPTSGERLMSDPANTPERMINVQDIDPRHRHTIIFQLFDHLAPNSSLLLIVDHNPKPLGAQLEAKHGSRCQWTYVEEGPDV
jgi:uncharacterized protein (DUF2249 family)